MTAEEVAKIVTDRCYTVNEDIIRRIRWYTYEDHTTLSVEDDRIVVKTEMPVKGVYNTMILYPDGKSEVKMEFDK